MAYTIYKNVQVLAIERQKAERTTRSQEIADPAKTRDAHEVTVARFSGVPYEATISDFGKHLSPKQKVSVAIDDKWRVIAVINHSRGEEASLNYSKMGGKEIWGILFFLAIPITICAAIARKAFKSVKHHDAGWYVMLGGIVIVVAILYGINKEVAESKAALRKMKD